MRLYTRGGDQGETSLFGGDRVGKCDPRIAAYGEVDELNAVIGWCVAAATPISAEKPDSQFDEIAQALLRESGRLFSLGAYLATPPQARENSALPEWESGCCKLLESEIDRWSGELPELKNFILPTGCELSCRLQIARTVCRRAERYLVALDCADDSDFVIYLNRMSDWLFCLSRLANHRAGVPEQPWTAQ